MTTRPRRRPSWVHTALLPVAMVSAFGVGCDSLLGEQGLGGLIGVDEPDNPTWDLRWFDGTTLVSDCALEFPGGDTVFLDAEFGGLELLPPDSPDAPPSVQGDGYTWSVAVMAVADSDTGLRESTADAPLEGIWGGAALHGLLSLQGDLARFEADFQLLEGDGTLREGIQTIEIFPQAIVESGNFRTAMMAVDPEITFTQEEGAVVADPITSIDPATEQLLRGEGIGGVTFEACP